MNYKLRRSIQQIFLAGATAVFTAGALATVLPNGAIVGPQNPPPGPGQIPDYFGITGNFANSPQPILTQVIINGGIGGGTGASANALISNTGGISGYTGLVGGNGYVAPQVAITDLGSGSGFGGYITFPTLPPPGAPIGGISSDNITVITGGSGYSPNAQVVFTDPTGTGSGAVGSVVLGANGSIQSITVTNPGKNYSTGALISVIDAPSGHGATATATVAGGVITKLTITAPGTGYKNPVITITETSTAGGGSGAVAVATTYDYPNDKPTDRVMDVQILNGGIGYNATATAQVIGGPGVNPVPITPIITNGAITGFVEVPSPTTTTFLGLGSGFKTPLTGTGLRKFVDQLSVFPGSSTSSGPNNLGQQLPVATPDTTTFPGSDYYELGEVVYTQKLHSDLPATHLRGYVQLQRDTHTPVGPAQYLGPIIIAQKGRPVRIKLVNLLPTDATGKLPFPVDTTYMGTQDTNDTDQRTSMHLHGGNTPWISDGTARQWVKPKGQGAGPYVPFTASGGNPNKGISARSVPDMWYDKTTGNVVPSCAGKTTCAVANSTIDVDGQLTFFYTNEQSARLMFYHEHAEGITRLGVYAGLAAPYILQDPTEQALVANGTLPGLADTIPIVIQDKTFVPDKTTPVMNVWGPFANVLQSSDPTWRWGTGTPATGPNGNGDLWVPHVFMTNQNPGDVTGANSMGRWDYGPWFWPPIVNIQNGQIHNPYYDPSCVSATAAIGFCESQWMPGVPNGSLKTVMSNGMGYDYRTSAAGTPTVLPNQVPGGIFDSTNGPTVARGGSSTESPTGTPEAFNDTPLVNGTAYPFVKVDPKKYRLRIHSVADDRMQNLSLVVAASNKSIDTTAQGNSSTNNSTILCDGSNGVSDYDKLPGQAPECTEIKMVPWTATQDAATPFPTWWYTPQKA